MGMYFILGRKYKSPTSIRADAQRIRIAANVIIFFRFVSEKYSYTKGSFIINYNL
ncbi:MAG: hypothetical protein UW72_C0007G0045 [Parcubacteria group bacterium GW2011_GWF2_44_7]|nr:MAG: hypothetical protein UW72_C0007G0045 [Parcubacteria group bacterium GW2011_GWF2_44_7]